VLYVSFDAPSHADPYRDMDERASQREGSGLGRLLLLSLSLLQADHVIAFVKTKIMPVCSRDPPSRSQTTGAVSGDASSKGGTSP